MAKPLMKIVVVGHVDHGKSTLIGRLLHDSGSLSEEQLAEIAEASRADDPEWALLLDHLAEERDEERTIDSAQAFFTTSDRTYRIIDAPGHKEFLKNMVTGASQAEAAILVVDVEAGVSEQTRRHAALLSMLGCREVVVVVNKMDLVDGRGEVFESAADDMREMLGELSLKPRCTIPISAMRGWNIDSRVDKLDWNNGPTLFDALSHIPNAAPLSDRPLRLPLQDVYEIGERRIYAGRIEGGRVAQGDRLISLPGELEVEVVSIERFGESREAAEAGESIGLVLQNCGAANNDLFAELGRGSVLCDPKDPPPAKMQFEAGLFWLSETPWTAGERLSLRCATQEVPCRIERVAQRIDSSTLEVIEQDATRLEHTEIGRVSIVAERPIAIEEHADGNALGRFVLAIDDAVCAGGTVQQVDND